ncbi:glycosyltransferase family 4 protein [Cryptosporangium aurantiacum]|uniref:Glycosyltransferase involved in cell wall bisynthesis n=1 Tax=Cryptosporangium aurantiacum TaxID=134849 RepID=A0A1M7QWY3_9ACTN|nr:glycosyltransferase family 4 protein [Cryptosporangium aurantiacum]SHN36531.1 Glycosyltransferase involved in cell wall bisynthesis [Cryptosporangium aurantiacum]
MKIVIAHNRYVSANPSGENTVVDLESRLLADAGVTVLPFQRSSDEIASLSKGQKALLPISPIYARTAQRELAALLESSRPDVLHLHNPYPLLSPWVIRTAHAHGVPVVHTVHNFRQVCANGLYFRDGHSCHDCLGKAYPYPAVQHSCYRGSKAQSALMATTLTVHRGTWHSVDRYLALTPAIADHLRSFGVSEAQITVKPNGVPDPGTHSQPGNGLLFVGRFSAEKGLNLLLDAWQRHPEGSLGTLRLIGDGPLLSSVTAAAAGRADIELLGRRTHDEVQDAMRSSAALVTPSTWDEVCPMVVVEALANGRPVLATAMGGLPFLVGSGSAAAGWTVPPEVDALAAVLPRVVAEAPGLATVARHRYEQKFSTTVTTAALLGVYEELIAARTVKR